MDRISKLHDDVLVKILSFVPTKVAVSTCVLSKRWKFLWMWLPKLKYHYCLGRRSKSLSSLCDFINKNLPLHRAPVIESLHLDLQLYGDQHIKPEDMKLWIEIAVASHSVRKLKIAANCREIIVPSSLFTCSSLVILKLKFVTLMNVPFMVCLPSLKSLELIRVKYGDKERLQELLSVCPVLEDLKLCIYENFRDDNRLQDFTVIVPSLQKLSLSISGDCSSLEWYEIDTPSLKYLKLRDWSECSAFFKNMPMLREAHLDLVDDPFHLKSVFRSITSVKRLAITSEDEIGEDLVFDQLEHLELYIYEDSSLNLLVQMLKNSPNLQVIDISEKDVLEDIKVDYNFSWDQPSFIPECILSSLQNLKWALTDNGNYGLRTCRFERFSP